MPNDIVDTIYTMVKAHDEVKGDTESKQNVNDCYKPSKKQSNNQTINTFTPEFHFQLCVCHQAMSVGAI